MKDALYGSYIRKIDETRIILPSEYDCKDEDVSILCKDYYISIMSKKTADELIDEKDAAGSNNYSCDNEKRLSITKKIKDCYEFKKKVAIISRKRYADIVPIEKLEQYEKENGYEELYRTENELILKCRK